MGCVRLLERPREQRPQFVIGQIADLLVDANARMIVDSEALVGTIIVQVQRPETRLDSTLVHESEAQRTALEQTVILARHRITPGQARDRPCQTIRREDDVVDLRQLFAEIGERFFRRTVVVPLETHETVALVGQ
ncbi:hypothetical protein HRbin27_00154 [bacterium HR27]|nr:hypothetical protein HRbin27_00154 [bacterium HR27]